MYVVRSSLVLAGLLTASTAAAQALTYSLADGSDGWPVDRRDAVTAAMDEAVDLFNRHGHFDKQLTANYNAGVPTAQASYSGWIDFGTQYNTRAAMHEISHALGTGTFWGFDGGTWDEDSAAGRLIKVFDGQQATLSTGGSHYWPYGLNYDDEDGVAARVRLVKLVAAFRFDMGIVVDSDDDGLPDDWETFHFSDLTQDGLGDPDEDGIDNASEYASDADPMLAVPLVDGGTYVLRCQATGLALTVAGASRDEAADTEQRGYDGAPSQQWTAGYVGDGFFSLTNVNSGKALEVPSTDTASGVPVQQADWTGALKQQWRVVDGGGVEAGLLLVANRETGRVLDGADGAAVQQSPFQGNIPQQFWSFEEVPPGDAEAADEPSPDRTGTAGDPGTEADAGMPATGDTIDVPAGPGSEGVPLGSDAPGMLDHGQAAPAVGANPPVAPAVDSRSSSGGGCTIATSSERRRGEGLWLLGLGLLTLWRRCRSPQVAPRALVRVRAPAAS